MTDLKLAVNDIYKVGNVSIRVDFIKDGEVYYIKWFDDDEHGVPGRMTVAAFVAATVQSKAVKQ